MAEAAVQSRMHLRHEAEVAGGRLPPLLVAALRVAATVQQGVHGRRRVGMGESFWQYRRYEPGDALRSIDWRASAKSDRIFVRETEWAAAQSIWLWRDASSSMAWASNKRLPLKRDRADLLTLAVASLLVRAGERIALLGSGERPIAGKPALDRLAMRMLAGPTPRIADDVPPFAPLPRHSVLLLIGDLLAPLDELGAVCRRYAARGVNGYLLQVLDPAEETLPYNGRTRFEGLQDEGHLLVKRAETVRDEYRRKMAEHQAGLADLARQLGWHYTLNRTDHSAESALLALFVNLTEAPR
jgi:uncharacterized protein (DUF58 family)